METAPAGVYEPRNPRATSLYALVEDHYEEFERVYDDRYQQQYGPWRKVIGEVMRKYLECGDLHRGFARIGCCGCRYQAILAYSCKCRLFCPACQQKRILLLAEWLDGHILEQVSHAQYVFTIPKLLRPIRSLRQIASMAIAKQNRAATANGNGVPRRRLWKREEKRPLSSGDASPHPISRFGTPASARLAVSLAVWDNSG